MLVEEGLVDRAGVVVEAARRSRDRSSSCARRDAERERALVDPAQLVAHPRHRAITFAVRVSSSRDRRSVDSCRQRRDRVDRVAISSARLLAEAIDLVEHRGVLLGGDPGLLEEAAQQLAVVDLDRERPERELVEDAVDHRRQPRRRTRAAACPCRSRRCRTGRTRDSGPSGRARRDTRAGSGSGGTGS